MILFRLEAEIALPQNAAEALSDERPRREYIARANDRLVFGYIEHHIDFVVQIAELKNGRVLAFLCCPPSGVKGGNIHAERAFSRALQALIPGCSLGSAACTELTVSEFDHGREKYQYEFSSRLRELIRGFDMDFLRFGALDHFDVSERIAASNGVVSKTTAKAAMRRLLPSPSMAAEIDRIFSSRHPKGRWYGFPVHYKLTVQSESVAGEMVDLLIRALYLNKRILSQRVTAISNFAPRRLDRDTVMKIMRCSQGSAVVVHLNGDVATEQEYASQFHQVTDILADCIKEFSEKILFIFVECTAHPGMAKQLLGKISGELDILPVEEGVGPPKEAEAYFRGLLAESNMDSFYEEGDVLFQSGALYSASEVRGKFNLWRNAALKNRVYCAYQDKSLTLHIRQAARSKGSAYDELQRLVGLSEVKRIISDIIAAYKVQKLRNKYYDPNEAVTRHMLFTGNPGTAKTTVARLMAEIMKENEILSTGAFIECGRADLVGKYVGWTARIVQEKFREAHGGVLFIDEAYSLVDASHSFGDEAINTIVQEMENRRSDVVVVFAGYPEKMERFLAQNEGLRSRIAFHVAFPDYTPDELMGILDKILKERQFKLTDGAKARAFDIFQTVHQQPEYGNGRFVRSLFEQAVNRQAARIMRLSSQDIGRESLFELCADDFDTNITKTYAPYREKQIGFSP